MTGSGDIYHHCNYYWEINLKSAWTTMMLIISSSINVLYLVNSSRLLSSELLLLLQRIGHVHARVRVDVTHPGYPVHDLPSHNALRLHVSFLRCHHWPVKTGRRHHTCLLLLLLRGGAEELGQLLVFGCCVLNRAEGGRLAHLDPSVGQCQVRWTDELIREVMLQFEVGTEVWGRELRDKL